MAWLLLSLSLTAGAHHGPEHTFASVDNTDSVETDGVEMPIRLDEDLPAEVVGGEKVSGSRWDATVGMVMWDAYVGCTGTLVHPRLVLTAAHCVSGISGVIIGSHDWATEEADEYIAAEWVTPHPDYNGYWGPDIAVVRLEKAAKQEPAKLGLECIIDNDLRNNSKVEVVGYGNTSASGGGYNSAMNHGTTRVQTKDCTDDTIDGIWTGCQPDLTPDGEIGAGGNGVDACFGDSGGPLYLRADSGDYNIGVTSRAYAGAPYSTPCLYGGIWTRPDGFIKWIEEAGEVNFKYSYCNEAPEVFAAAIGTKPGKTGETLVEVIDSDGDASLATVVVAQEPEFGTVEIDGLVVRYTAGDGFEGTDTVVITVTDGGNDDYKRTGEPSSVDYEIPVEAVSGLFTKPTRAGQTGGALLGCDTTRGTGAGWVLAALGVLAIRRRRD